jgi:hypothetical protein
MRRFALIVLSSSIFGCAGTLRFQATDTPPPPPQASVVVTADAPAATVDAQASTDDSSAPAAPEVTAAEPEEVTATTEPPDPLYEEQPAPPDPTFVWVGGYWGWTGTDWGWTPGGWLAPPQGRVYVAPYYERVGANVVYVHGYWGPHDAPVRSYGGERIEFAVATRPADYHRGDYRHYERRAGMAPGSRPGRAYAHATGSVRPLPHATAPSHVEGSARVASSAHEQVSGHEAPSGHEAVAARGPTNPSGHEAVAARGPTNPSEDKAPASRDPGKGEAVNETDKSATPRAASVPHAAPPAQHPAPAAHQAPPPKKKK